MLSRISGTLGLHTYLDDLWQRTDKFQFILRGKPQLPWPFSFDSQLASLDRLMLNLKFLVLAFKNFGSSKTACLVLSFFFFCTFLYVSVTSLQPFTYSHLLQTSPLLLLCCPNLCTDFLNSASCCDAHRQKAKYKCLD